MFKTIMKVSMLSFLLMTTHALHAIAASPDGVTFFSEIMGYSGYQLITDDQMIVLDFWDASLDVDTDGDLWVCSLGHVFEYRDGGWIDHTEASGGGFYVSVTSQGTVWVASPGHLASYNGEAWTDHSEGIPDRIRALSAEGSDVWLACSDDNQTCFLVCFNGETVASYHEGLLQNYISRLTATPDGVWIVHHNLFDELDCVGDDCPRGTSFFDGTTFHYHSIDNGMPGNNVNTDTNVPWVVYSVRQDRVYAICNGKLVEYADDQWLVVIDHASSIPFVEGYNGTLWQGSLANIMWDSSLSYMADDTWMEFDVTEIRQWINNDVSEEYDDQMTSSIAAAENGIVWIGITNGIVRIDTKKLPLPATGIEADIPAAVSPKIVCYPNPFNNATTIQFELAETSRIEADIHAINGQRICHLSSGWLPAGSHTLQWDGRSAAGNQVSSGMYLVNIRAGNIRLVSAMTFMK